LKKSALILAGAALLGGQPDLGFGPDLGPDRRLLRLKPQLGKAICVAGLSLLTFNPSLFDQICKDPGAIRQARGLDPAGASQVLHELSLTGVRRFHFFAFSRIGRQMFP